MRPLRGAPCGRLLVCHVASPQRVALGRHSFSLPALIFSVPRGSCVFFPGFLANPIDAICEFNAQLQIVELVDNAIFTAGYKEILHIHAIVEECEIIELTEEIDMKKKKDNDLKNKKPKRKPHFVKSGAIVVCRIQVNNLICIENFSDFAQLGRFTLRTEGKTVAVGKVVALPPLGSSTFSSSSTNSA